MAKVYLRAVSVTERLVVSVGARPSIRLRLSGTGVHGNVNANYCHPHMSERVKGVEDTSDYERLVDEDVPSKILRSKEGDRCTNEGANGYLASGSVYLNVMRMQFRGWGTSTQLSV